MSATFTVRFVGNVAIVDCMGRITLGEDTYGLRDQIRGLAFQGHTKVILNLAKTVYVDSCGIAGFVDSFTALSNCGGSLKLLALTKTVKDLLQIAKLYTVFEVFDDEEAAIRSFT